MIKSLKDLLDKFSRFTNSLVYDGGICKRLGGMTFNFGGVPFAGIGLGAIVGVVLNLVLPKAI